MNKDKVFVKGLYFNHPRPNAPEFVIGALSIHVDRLKESLAEIKPNDAGYINIDVLNSKENKPYCVLNEYVRPKNEEYEEPHRNKREEVTQSDVDLSSVPF